MRKISVGIIIVLMLLSPSICAISDMSLKEDSEVDSQNIVKTSKPDLIITDIWYEIDPWFQPIQRIGIKIKNIGDEKVNESEDINIYFVVKKWIFIKYKTYDITIEGGLEPGKGKKLIVINLYQSEGFLPGFYKFESYVNPDKTIDESDYNNNDRIERAFNLMYFWIGFW